MEREITCSECRKPVGSGHWHAERHGESVWCSRRKQWRDSRPDWMFDLCKGCGNELFSGLIKERVKFEKKRMKEIAKLEKYDGDFKKRRGR